MRLRAVSATLRLADKLRALLVEKFHELFTDKVENTVPDEFKVAVDTLLQMVDRIYGPGKLSQGEAEQIMKDSLCEQGYPPDRRSIT